MRHSYILIWASSGQPVLLLPALLNSFPESEKGDEYKLMVIKSYFRFAELSIEEKKAERYEQVITECNDFVDRFPESKLVKEVNDIFNLSQ